MTARKKRGVGFLVGGLVTIVFGVLFLSGETTPGWAMQGVVLLGAVLEALGFTAVFPDVEK